MSDSSPAPGSSDPSDPAPPPARRRLRRAAIGCASLLLGGPLAVVAGGTFALRHVPYTIPAADRPPAAARCAPEAPVAAGLRLRWLGVTGYEVSDGRTTLVLDPAVTRPRLPRLVAGPLEPDAALSRAWMPRADYVLVNHAHYDHAIDLPEVAQRTGAVVVGSGSTVNLARSRGVPEERLRQVRPGERLTLGTFEVVVGEARHTAIGPVREPMMGLIPPDAGRLWFFEYRADASLTYRLEAGGASLWFHPSSTYHAPGELQGLPAATLILGVTGEPLDAERARSLLGECQPARVLPTHHDNFFQPLEAGLALMPGLDLPAARAIAEAARPGVAWWVLDHGETVLLPPD